MILIEKFGFVTIPHAKDWQFVPNRYRTKDNYAHFCYLRYMGLDALAVFMEAIKSESGLTDTEKPKTNPYNLIWYREGWSKKRIEKNNAKYWEWEIKNNRIK